MGKLKIIASREHSKRWPKPARSKARLQNNNFLRDGAMIFRTSFFFFVFFLPLSPPNLDYCYIQKATICNQIFQNCVKTQIKENKELGVVAFCIELGKAFVRYKNLMSFLGFFAYVYLFARQSIRNSFF